MKSLLLQILLLSIGDTADANAGINEVANSANDDKAAKTKAGASTKLGEAMDKIKNRKQNVELFKDKGKEANEKFAEKLKTKKQVDESGNKPKPNKNGGFGKKKESGKRQGKTKEELIQKAKNAKAQRNRETVLSEKLAKLNSKVGEEKSYKEVKSKERERLKKRMQMGKQAMQRVFKLFRKLLIKPTPRPDIVTALKCKKNSFSEGEGLDCDFDIKNQGGIELEKPLICGATNVRVIACYLRKGKQPIVADSPVQPLAAAGTPNPMIENKPMAVDAEPEIQCIKKPCTPGVVRKVIDKFDSVHSVPFHDMRCDEIDWIGYERFCEGVEKEGGEVRINLKKSFKFTAGAFEKFGSSAELSCEFDPFQTVSNRRSIARVILDITAPDSQDRAKRQATHGGDWTVVNNGSRRSNDERSSDWLNEDFEEEENCEIIPNLLSNGATYYVRRNDFTVLMDTGKVTKAIMTHKMKHGKGKRRRNGRGRSAADKLKLREQLRRKGRRTSEQPLIEPVVLPVTPAVEPAKEPKRNRTKRRSPMMPAHKTKPAKHPNHDESKKCDRGKWRKPELPIHVTYNLLHTCDAAYQQLLWRIIGDVSVMVDCDKEITSEEQRLPDEAEMEKAEAMAKMEMAAMHKVLGKGGGMHKGRDQTESKEESGQAEDTKNDINDANKNDEKKGNVGERDKRSKRGARPNQKDQKDGNSPKMKMRRMMERLVAKAKKTAKAAMRLVKKKRMRKPNMQSPIKGSRQEKSRSKPQEKPGKFGKWASDMKRRAVYGGIMDIAGTNQVIVHLMKTYMSCDDRKWVRQMALGWSVILVDKLSDKISDPELGLQEESTCKAKTARYFTGMVYDDSTTANFGFDNAFADEILKSKSEIEAEYDREQRQSVDVVNDAVKDAAHSVKSKPEKKGSKKNGEKESRPGKTDWNMAAKKMKESVMTGRDGMMNGKYDVSGLLKGLKKKIGNLVGTTKQSRKRVNTPFHQIFQKLEEWVDERIAERESWLTPGTGNPMTAPECAFPVIQTKKIGAWIYQGIVLKGNKVFYYTKFPCCAKQDDREIAQFVGRSVRNLIRQKCSGWVSAPQCRAIRECLGDALAMSKLRDDSPEIYLQNVDQCKSQMEELAFGIDFDIHALKQHARGWNKRRGQKAEKALSKRLSWPQDDGKSLFEGMKRKFTEDRFSSQGLTAKGADWFDELKLKLDGNSGFGDRMKQWGGDFQEKTGGESNQMFGQASSGGLDRQIQTKIGKKLAELEKSFAQSFKSEKYNQRQKSPIGSSDKSPGKYLLDKFQSAGDEENENGIMADDWMGEIADQPEALNDDDDAEDFWSNDNNDEVAGGVHENENSLGMGSRCGEAEDIAIYGEDDTRDTFWANGPNRSRMSGSSESGEPEEGNSEVASSQESGQDEEGSGNGVDSQKSQANEGNGGGSSQRGDTENEEEKSRGKEGKEEKGDEDREDANNKSPK